ncbi:hypothetical protein ANO14919_103500 [Xylariales sp. No.14919]|nr:hypothetical protein ANO14919_103500 [Xylariales sp. No.14919]
MKLVIAGSTGYVATELIRQALAHSKITSIIALGRREAPLPSDAELHDSKAKLRSIICHDFEVYSDSIKAELAEADACIWAIAIPPSKLQSVTWEEACKISRDYAVTAVKVISQLRRDSVPSKFRFIYISGSNAERDPSKKPPRLGDYCLMRGEAEIGVLASAQESNGAVEACIAKPGLIESPHKTVAPDRAVNVPRINLSDLSAALLDQVVNGFEKDTLQNEDLIRIGRSLAAQGSSWRVIRR